MLAGKSGTSPRNFKEKIELLRKKEATSTANFTAAMRDAQDIRQIAGSQDPEVIKNIIAQKNLAFDFKAHSLPNVYALSSNPTDQYKSMVDSSSACASNTTPTYLDLTDASSRVGSTQSPSLSSSNQWHAAKSHVQPYQPSSSSSFTHYNKDNFHDSSISRLQQQSRNKSAAYHNYPHHQQDSRHLRHPAPTAKMPHSLLTTAQSSPHVGSYASASTPLDTSHPQSHTYHHQSYYPTSYPSSNLYNQQQPSQQASYHHHHQPSRPVMTCSSSTLPATSPSTAAKTCSPSYSSSTRFNLSQQHPQVSHLHRHQQLHLGTSSSAAGGVDWRRVASDSSIQQSTLLAASPAACINLPATSQTSSHQVPTYSAYHQQTYPSSTGNAVQSSIDSNNQYHQHLVSSPVKPTSSSPLVKRPRLTASVTVPPAGSVLSSSPHQLTPSVYLPQESRQYDSVFVEPTSTVKKNVYCPPPASSSLSSSQQQPTTDVFMSDSSNRASLVDHSNNSTTLGASTTDPLLSSYGGGEASSSDFDLYLPLPSVSEFDDNAPLAGRRESCTMTAEYLSSITPNSRQQNQIQTTTLSNSSSLVAGSDSNGHEQSRTSDSDQKRNSDDMQQMASSLGISMSANDYQLLTDPQLVDFVTDDATEAQLLN